MFFAALFAKLFKFTRYVRQSETTFAQFARPFSSQVKKSAKWVCKVCNSKQSVTKVYGEGTAADCRKRVQKLNMMRAQKEQQIGLIAGQLMPADAYSSYHTDDLPSPIHRSVSPHKESPHDTRRVIVSGADSKWMAFMDVTEQNTEEEEQGGRDSSVSTSTSEQNCEQAKKKRRMAVKSHHGNRDMRVTGFHPIATTSQPPAVSARETGSTSDGLLPYSSVGEKMESILDHYQHVTTSDTLFATKSSTTLSGTIGQYHPKLNYDSDETLSSSVSETTLEAAKDLHSGSLRRVCKSVGTGRHTQSKWNQFLPLAVDED